MILNVLGVSVSSMSRDTDGTFWSNCVMDGTLEVMDGALPLASLSSSKRSELVLRAWKVAAAMVLAVWFTGSQLRINACRHVFGNEK